MSSHHSDQMSQRSQVSGGQSVVFWRLWLLVGSDRATKGQGHLLSCCGQLKRKKENCLKMAEPSHCIAWSWHQGWRHCNLVLCARCYVEPKEKTFLSQFLKYKRLFLQFMLLGVPEKPNFRSTQFTVVPLVHSANMSAVQYIEPNIRPFVYHISEPQYLGGNDKLLG